MLIVSIHQNTAHGLSRSLLYRSSRGFYGISSFGICLLSLVSLLGFALAAGLEDH